MKALFIGGTGVISTAVGALALAQYFCELAGTVAPEGVPAAPTRPARPGARGCLQRTSMTKLR